MAPQEKSEAAFLKVLTTAIAANVMSGYTSTTKGENSDGTESGRQTPCYVVEAQDMPEYPKFTGNVRGNVEVMVFTAADIDPEVTADDPAANHARNVALVGDALRPTDAQTLEAKLTTAGRAQVTDFTCLQCRYLGTTKRERDGRNFKTTHVFSLWMAPSNVS